ncbi:DEAD/DEAH box helicase [Iodobacter fluviatilis]|uniref:ATP-dependent helicase HepA n=1 Tax=Iodobacter fluviatilis TaxID=537 RepID=A0A377QD71_9NEIS|nr:DEAD/DEAH box helicase [Iodobacter fluviatilis]TCU83672.1 helicase-like protein [Iodobacter fluviatilis]STQ91821.1 ATP-dependent helicase HepA [Iodobacter fluviatilis]
MPQTHKLSAIHPDDLPLIYAMALFQEPMPQVRLITLMQLRKEKMANGRAYDQPAVKACLARLMLQKMATLQTGMGYVLENEFVFPALLKLKQSGWLPSWVGSVRDLLTQQHEYSPWKNYPEDFCQREILFSAFCGQIEIVNEWRQRSGLADRVAQHFFASESGQILFGLLDEEIQCQLLLDALQSSAWYLTDCNAMYQYALSGFEQRFDQWPQLSAQLAAHALLRGDFAQLKLIQRRTPAQYLAENLAALATLRGEYSIAVEIYDSLLKALKQASGKRKYFLTDTNGLLYTVALLGLNTPASIKLAKAQVDDGYKQKHANCYFALHSLVDHLAQGTPLISARPGYHYQPNDCDGLFEALALFWQDADVDDSWCQKLLTARAKAVKNGYQWIAAELDVLLFQQFGKPLLSPGWHAQQQLTPLISAIKREEGWQRALVALSQLKAGTPASSSDARIAWLIETSHGDIRIDPREQKKSAKGIWSKGRAVALRRMLQEQDTLPAMSDQDKRVASCIRKSYNNYYGGSEYELDAEAALAHLIGHPALFWFDAPDVRIDIAKGEVALLLKEKQGQITLQLDPEMDSQASLIWKKETPTRLVIYSSSPEIKQIAGILGTGLAVPVAAKAQLVDVITAIAPHIAIHSDLPELAAHVESIDADATLYAHLLPLQEGLRMQLLVRPLADGSWMTPAKGSVNVLGEIEGRAVQAVRDLSAEKKRLKRVVDGSPTLSQAEQNGVEWELFHPELCLELLAELKTFGEDTLQLVWPEGERFRLNSTRGLAQMSLTVKKQGEWFVAGGELTLDDGRVLALRELLQMMDKAEGRFLPLGDGDYLALTEAFKKRLDELRVLAEMGKDGLKISALTAPLLAELAGEVGDLQSDAEWQAQVAKLDSLADFQPEVPSTLQATLRDYQLEGFQWLSRLARWGVGACLADDMGLGKTVQALALLLTRAPQGPALVIAPLSVALNWQAEALRFAPTLKVQTYHSNRDLSDLGPFDLVIASYGMLQQDSEAFAAQHWHSVVLDEAQAIKNSATKRSQAAMALNADFKVIASGTPVENHLGELWNLFRFINPGLLGSKERFAAKFSGPIERGDKTAKQHLKKLIQPFILRRTKTQVLSELPPRTEITLKVELSKDERHLYEALRQEAVEKLDAAGGDENRAMRVLAEITRLRRFCCNPKLTLPNSTLEGSKLAAFADITEELLENKHKALVFSQFVDHLAIVREWLEQKGISYQYLDGSTPVLERKKRVDAFQAGIGDVFLISLKAGGTGLNLTAADYVIHLDPWWNPAVEDQASDRAHRMGQQRPVTIYRLVAQDTIEEQILALHAEKRDLADSLLEGGDATGKMDTAALLGLLRGGN